MSRLTPSVSFNVMAILPSNLALLLVRNQRQRRARSPVAPVIDPADAGHQRVGGILDLPLAGLTHELTHRLDQIVRGTGRLPRRDLAAAGVEGQRAVIGKISIAHEGHALARL